MMTRRALLAGSLILSALAAGPWSQAMASDYLGQFCLVLTIDAELIDDVWSMSLLSTWEQGNHIYHIRLVPETLEGDFARMGREFDPLLLEFESSFVTGNVIGFTCAVVEPGSVCDDLPILAGHLPPPGSCRVWNPALPDGEQRPPGGVRCIHRARSRRRLPNRPIRHRHRDRWVTG